MSVLKSLIVALLVKIISAKVNLTTDRNVSLVGPHCPGTINIFCEGTALTSLRWSFNDGIVIKTFLPDDKEGGTFLPDQNIFFVLLIKLTNSVHDLDLVFGNLSSILTVNLSKLEEESVTNISCGDPATTTETVPVSVTIIKQVIPNSPNITEVTATYVSASLRSITIAWNKVIPTDCIQRESYITYIASLNGSGSTEVNGTMCEASVCSASFNVQSDVSSTVHQLTLFAMNSIGSSALVKYPIPIASQSEQYITPVLSSNGCNTSGQCLSSGSLKNITCHLQYTTDPEYQDLSTAIMAPLNTPFEVPSLSLDVTYFVFSVNLSTTFRINERLEFIPKSNSCQPTEGIKGIIMITLTGIFIALSLPLLIIMFALLYSSFRFRGSNKACSLRLSHIFQTVSVVLCATCILLLTIATTLITIVEVCRDAVCSIEWQRSRDGFLLSGLVTSITGFCIIFILFVVVLVKYCCSGRRTQKLPQTNENQKSSFNSQERQNGDADKYVSTYANVKTQVPPQRGSNKAMVTNGAKEAEYDTVNWSDKVQDSIVLPNAINPDHTYSAIDLTEKYHDQYDSLRHSNKLQDSSRPIDTIQTYSTIDQTSVQPRGVGNYEILRCHEKSKAIHNMEDPNYSKLAKPTIPKRGWLKRMHQHGKQDDENFEKNTAHVQLDSGTYDTLRSIKLAVPNAPPVDSNYSHLQEPVRKEQSGKKVSKAPVQLE